MFEVEVQGGRFPGLNICEGLISAEKSFQGGNHAFLIVEDPSRHFHKLSQTHARTRMGPGLILLQAKHKEM